MNPRLDQLRLYPFERLARLLEGVETRANDSPVAWSAGEPKHRAPDFVVQAFADEGFIRKGLGAYPPTKGLPELRAAIAGFLERRYNLPSPPDPERHILPVVGTREALFAFGQAVIDAADPGLTLMPNPFYQIYEGTALLAGSQPHYLNCTQENGFLPDLAAVPSQVWQRCRLIYICTPGNPTGTVMPVEMLQQLIQLSDEYGFVIASDECYSEIYQDEAQPPPGLLEAAARLGRQDYRNCVAFNSLSKRSNLPGLRSGYVAGDPELIAAFFKYRTYHGSAMPVHHQLASIAAWQDEDHVVANRAIYREKFARVTEILRDCWPVEAPPASFYLWPETPVSDEEFTVRLLREANIKVLPGSYLSRDTAEGNPGANRVRIALVATLEECEDAALRLQRCWPRLLRG